MYTLSPSPNKPIIKYDFLKSLNNDALPRDKTQSHRLHEPTQRISRVDPMTGKDIHSLDNHPYLVDGNLTIYFETHASRNAYQNLPFNHPSLHLPYPSTDDDDRGG